MHFDLELIELYGWYSPTGKHGKNRDKMNLGGVSRDHLFSVADGFRLGIDPEIMAHPANCKIMVHSENNQKNGRSEITIDQLLERVKKWKIIAP